MSIYLVQKDKKGEDELRYQEFSIGTYFTVVTNRLSPRLNIHDIVRVVLSTDAMNEYLIHQGYSPHTNDGAMFVTKQENFKKAKNLPYYAIYFHDSNDTGIHCVGFKDDIRLLETNKNMKFLLDTV